MGSINLGLNYAEHEQGPPFPFPECGAMSQAYIGYQMQESLLNELHTLGIKKEVVTLVTQVEVANDDPRFNHQQNQLDYSILKNKKTKEEKGYTFMEDAGRGYRRVVPSPQPINIVELDSIETLIKHGTLVIARVVAVSQLLRNKIVIKVSMQSLIKIRQVHYLRLIYNRIN